MTTNNFLYTREGRGAKQKIMPAVNNFLAFNERRTLNMPRGIQFAMLDALNYATHSTRASSFTLARHSHTKIFTYGIFEERDFYDGSE